MGKYLAKPVRQRRRGRKGHWGGVLLLAALAVMLVVSGVCLLPGQPAVATEMQDLEPPRITGVRDLTVYEGGTVAYMTGVKAEDDLDGEVAVQADSSAVDLSQAGSYDVYYTAEDAAGNTSTARAVVWVLEKKEGYADMETILAAADAKLAQLLPEEYTTREAVEIIYQWAKGTLTYGGHSDREDWRQAGYTMLTGGSGDCFGYFAATKLLFERLGIPNIDVRKVKNDPEDTEHYWSLVSIDGGKNYYHFDCTPRIGDGDDFCLVTDAFLDAYSAAHGNSHNRNTPLYPKTPEEAL